VLDKTLNRDDTPMNTC